MMSAKFRTNCLKASPALLFLLFFQFAGAQNRFEGAAAIIDQQAKTLKQELVLVVASKDTTLFTKDSKTFSALRGQADLGQSSQWLTAALVMVLVDEGKISLDDKVSQYIPAFASYGKSYITIGNCLSHFTGIHNETNKAIKFFEKKKFANLEEAVAGYVKKEIQNNAGEAHRYNTMGPDIAGRVLEIVTRKKFDMLAQQKLLRPLGMRQTTFSTLDGSALSPADGARGTAADYTRFLRMLLNNGMHNGQRILSEASVAALRKIMTSPANRKFSPEGMQGFEYTSGAWSVGTNPGAVADVLSAPSFGGTTPLVDFCRGYAFMYLQKEATEEAKVPVRNQLRAALEPLFPGKCQ
ncbi:CubicO group peptidase, beta-lactamase class C family [Cnuella takakiae]|uniref:CubicO group peptidase, beta-lactamase class C family n=1 Tax=Cnuella takakiae TaxID=1302690 RepID=A0A1M4XV95_9BACT|nr:serine hydrolase domain-containing protein [Cnuella takakiae]OLY92952.1 hypothetical protein BUE76_14420 [Cnuella takakiae]SHE97213.1 CubicO group peptidase, beta-lactamase class C family [Cnuella takakiae]